MSALPYRGPRPGRPEDIPLPPQRMPLLRGGRLLKCWRYVGVYGPDISLCVGSARIGPMRQSFWAVWERDRQRFHEHTVLRRGGVRLDAGRVRVRDGGVEIDLALDENAGVEVVVPDGSGYVWTAKQGAVPARGSVRVHGEERIVDALAVIDDTAGYHPRHTVWQWTAGVGAAVDGRTIAWNLVAGINDPPRDSERAVWVDGVASEVGPVSFADDLSALAFAEGGELRFAQEALRARRDNVLVIRSEYAQPFGTFSGKLPGGIELAEAYGVMERHDAHW